MRCRPGEKKKKKTQGHLLAFKVLYLQRSKVLQVYIYTYKEKLSQLTRAL